jgi:hypothetical protein
VYFDFLESLDKRGISIPPVNDDMHQGEVYIFLNQILLHDSNCWYKANIQEIQNIKTVIPKKQIIICFGIFDIVLACNELTNLLALRDFLNLSQQYFEKKQTIISRPTNNIAKKFQRMINGDHDRELHNN